MTTLDRAILKQFLTNAALLFFFLSAMIIAVDFALQFDEYAGLAKAFLDARASAPAGTQSSHNPLAVGFWSIWLALDLWWPRLFLLYAFLLGPVLVGSVGFTLSAMVRGRELVALLAGGVSLYRVARPILLATLALLLVQTLNREFVLPQLAPLLTRGKDAAGQRTLGVLRDFTSDAQGRLFYAREANLDTGVIDGLFVLERDASGKGSRRITADQARWENAGWTLINGRETPFSAGNDVVGPGTRLEGRAIDRLVTDIDPTTLRLRRFEAMAGNLGTRQLSQLIARYRGLSDAAAATAPTTEAAPSTQAATGPTQMIQRRIDALERIRWGRVSAMLCTLLSVVIALPFFLRKEPANMIRQSLLVSPVALASFALTLAGTGIALPGVPAQLAAFVPAMLLLPLAIAAVSAVKS